MEESLRRSVWQRAGGCCEYCRLPQQVTVLPHQIDHIVARKHGGQTTEENLCLACYRCNVHKGPNIAGVDPQTGEINSPERLAHRALLIAEGVFPPS